MDSKVKVALVQHGVWAMPLESMPLGVGYLKACMDAEDDLAAACDTYIVNLKGGVNVGDILSAVFSDQVPHVLAMSVFGWNYRQSMILAETFKQLRPDGLVVVGGTHVANQAERVFRMSPHIDIVVNGEGEHTFPEVVRAWLTGELTERARGILGISFREEDKAVTTEDRPNITNLDEIPSPFLTGAIPMVNQHGKFRYDVAIMETNRGCPYHCAFCYWGGAIGQKVRRFSRERLVAELELIAHHEVGSIVLCDANFGMLVSDEEFLEDVIRLRERTGFPRAIESSWAKNKSAIFHRIVRRMKEVGLHSSFTIALQTMADDALQEMNRKNMKLNDWRQLTEWLASEGMECYAELIWGAPGESRESFLEGYDDLARIVPRIAAYPLMILPNTDYAEKREALGLVTSRGTQDDFEYVLATNTMSFQDNLEMQKFLLWARASAENSYFRNLFVAVREYAGLTQSTVLMSLADWFDACPDDAADDLKSPSAILEPGPVNAAVRALFLNPGVRDLLQQWWEEEIQPQIPEDAVALLDEVFRYDVSTLPRVRAMTDPADITLSGGLEVVKGSMTFLADVPALVTALRANETPSPECLRPTRFDFEWRLGIEDYVDNHEEAIQFIARATDIERLDLDSMLVGGTPVLDVDRMHAAERGA